MQRAAALLCGRHDFASFMSAGSTIAAEGGSTVRTVRAFAVRRQGSDLLFTIEADGYLYNMVRILVGTLVEIGAGACRKRSAGDLAARDRTRAGPTARPRWRWRLLYDEFVIGEEGEP